MIARITGRRKIFVMPAVVTRKSGLFSSQSNRSYYRCRVIYRDITFLGKISPREKIESIGMFHIEQRLENLIILLLKLCIRFCNRSLFQFSFPTDPVTAIFFVCKLLLSVGTPGQHY